MSHRRAVLRRQRGQRVRQDGGLTGRLAGIRAGRRRALGRVERYELGDGELVLSGPSLRLRFEREPPVPTQELVGTDWELDTLLAGEVASTPSAPARLRLEEDGSRSCR